MEAKDQRRQRPSPLRDRQELGASKFWTRRTAKLSEPVMVKSIYSVCVDTVDLTEPEIGSHLVNQTDPPEGTRMTQ